MNILKTKTFLLPAEAVYWKKLFYCRIFAICKLLIFYFLLCGSMVHYNTNFFILVMRSCNADYLVSKYNAEGEKEKTRKKCFELLVTPPSPTNAYYGSIRDQRKKGSHCARYYRNTDYKQALPYIT